MTADFLPYPMEFLARTATRVEELEESPDALAAGDFDSLRTYPTVVLGQQVPDQLPDIVRHRGYVRDLRVRSALEEAGLPYRVEGTPFRT